MYRLEFSPPKPPPKLPTRSKWFAKDTVSPETENNERSVVILESFSPVAHLSFNKVKLGCTKSCILYVYNPKTVSQVVRIDKFPNDKGFLIDVREFIVEAGVEQALKIDWIPEKSSSCRGIIYFSTSLGCKTQAILLGTSYSPKKVVKKVISCKSHKLHQHKKSPKVNQTYDKKTLNTKSLKVSDERKENLDWNNSASLLFANLSECSKDKFFTTPDAKVCFNLKIGDEFPDSPIRRQTYTINSMLSHGRDSTILPFGSKETYDVTDVKSNWRKGQADVDFSALMSQKQTCNNSLQCLKEQSDDIFNDSLENKSIKTEDASIYFNDSLNEVESKCKASYFQVTGIKDSVKTFDVASKHFYFGVTPQQPKCSESYVRTQEYMLNDSSMVSFKDLEVPTNSVDLHTMPLFKEPAIFKQPLSPKDEKETSSQQISSLDYKSGTSPTFQLNKLQISDMVFPSDFCTEKIEVKKEPTEQKYAIENQDFNGIKTEQNNIQILNPYDSKGGVLKAAKNSLVVEISSDFPSINSCQPLQKISNKSISNKLERQHSFKAKVLQPQTLPQKPEKKSCQLDYAEKRKVGKFLPKKLSLAKSKLSEHVYQRNPFASMNIYYDEHWIEKQEAAFTSWLNFILTPNDDFGSEDIKVDSAKLWVESIKESSPVPAPTKEELSLKAYTAARNLNLLRSSSFNLYQSENIVSVIKRIEREVDLKKLNIRKDRAIHADLGIKKNILQMLLSYNTLWLRIGLETVYGEVINLQSNSDVLGLSRFIVRRFLQNPEISAKFCHPGVINYYKKGYEDEIHRFILKKFLLLVFYLDTAKTDHLIKHNPCLFNKTSKYKSSRDLLLVFSREYLSGEGDITKHLRYLGYKVSHEQTAIEEFDYSVRNIATDLRCGLRLGRVVELLLQDWTISQMLRVNTLNRLSKIHNNDVILKALKNASIEIENNIEARHVTDGDREKTLDLLWQIIFKTQISKLINKDLLKKENAFLLRSLKLKADFAAYNSLRNNDSIANGHEIYIYNSKLYKENEILQLLFHWCQNVCAYYGIKVHNFTSSFSDGRALCLLLHHYHPNVLPLELIKLDTSTRYFEMQMEVAEKEENCPFFMKDGQYNELMDKLLKNERDNLTLVFQKFQEVGHIPILSRPSDMSNTMPDEKVMVTLVSYINIRLMELSIETRAARKIFHAWCKYKLRQQQKKLQMEIQAVCVIQKAWRKFALNRKLKREIKASTLIQSYWKMYSAKKELAYLKERKRLQWLTQNAIIIQAAFRGFSARRHLLKCHKASIIIQTCFRRWFARSQFMQLKNVVIKIQQNYRAKVAGRAQHLRYLNYKKMIKRRSARIILTAWKKFVIMKRMKLEINASTLIQSLWRMHTAKKALAHLKAERLQLLTKKAILIQSVYRGYRARKLVLHYHQAATIIQKSFRRFSVQSQFVKLKNTAIYTQQKYRAKILGQAQRLKYLKYRKMIQIKSARIIQKAWRRFQENRASIVIQSYWRMYSAKKELAYLKEKRIQCLTENAIVIQAAFRGYLVRKYLLKCHVAATIIQKYVRRWHFQHYFIKLKNITRKIQQVYRAKVLGRSQRRKYLNYQQMLRVRAARTIQKAWKKNRENRAATVIQKHWRMYSAKKELAHLKKQRFEWFTYKAVIIQAAYRGYTARKHILKCKQACIIIQKNFRRWCAQSHFIQLKRVTIKIQQKHHARVIGRKQRVKYLRYKQMVYARAAHTIQKAWKKKRENRAAIIIQKYWRMHSAKKELAHLKQRFVWHTQKAVIIQATYRGYTVRKHISRCNHACIIIQKNFRRWCAQSHFIQLKKVTTKIQQKHRAIVLGRKQRIKYLSFQQMVHVRAARIIQKAWIKKRENRAAIMIQKYWRMYSAKKELAHLKKQQFEWLTQKAVIIQAAYRGYTARKHITKCNQACVIIQKNFRRWHAQSYFIHLQKVTIKIQQKYHARVMGTKQRIKYLSYKHMVRVRATRIIQKAWKKKRENRAAIVIQKHWRMYSAKTKLAHLKKQQFEWLTQKAIIIQAAYRGYAARKQISKCNQACIVIQKNFRRWRAHSHYLQLKKITIKIQKMHLARVIGRKQRLKYLSYQQMVKTRASRIIQRTWRRRKENRASAVIQSFWRMHQAKKELAYLKEKKLQWLSKNAIIIQSAYRGFLVRKHLLKLNHAATVVQKTFRCWTAHSQFIKLKTVVVRIQQIHRARVVGRFQRLKYLNYRKMMQIRAAKIIQRAWKHKREYRAAAVIQTCWRIYSAKKELTSLKKQKFELLTKNAIIIQAAYRGYSVRKHFALCHQSACVIQANFRKWRIHSQYKKLKYFSKRIQEIYRARIAGRIQRIKYINYCKMIQNRAARIIQVAWKKKKKQKASLIIQSYWKMYCAKKKLAYLKKIRHEKLTRNATIIQTAYRGYAVRKKLLLYHKSATIIQKYFRRWCIRTQFVKLKCVSIKLQQRHRAKVAGRLQRLKYLNYCTMIQMKAAKTIQRAWKRKKENKASTVIQSYWRMYSAKKTLAELKKNKLQLMTQNAIIIQAVYRSYSVRKHLQKCHQAATVIQKYFRRWHTQYHFVKSKKIIIKIQQTFRAKVAFRIQRTKYLNYKDMIKRRAVRIIQEAWLQFLTRQAIKKELASTIIQKSWKMYLAKKELALLKEQKKLNRNAVIIQAAYRGFCVRRHLLKKHQAAITIQKYFRRWHAYSEYTKLIGGVLKIQQSYCARVVGKMQRLKYLNYCKKIYERAARIIQKAWRRKRNEKASIVIQSYWKMYLAKKELSHLKELQKLKCLNENAVLIQAVYRGYYARKCISKWHQAATVIQKQYRLWVVKKDPITSYQREWYINFRNNLIYFQKTARAYLKKQQNAAVTIQSYWRAYRVRCAITDKKICRAREKILAADSSESKKLKNRTTKSLELLFENTLLQNMIAALVDLDVCTQLSPNCCERLVQSGGLSILLNLVQRCNRSLPHMELIKLTTNILLNLAKYEKTVSYVWEEKHILEIILYLMKIFREKGTVIFAKCCSLLWIFCQDPSRAQIMKENSFLTDQICSFHYLLTRKQTFEARRQVAKASKSFNSCMSRTTNISILLKDSERTSLQIDPDWLLGRHRRREFKDPIVAITWIMKNLGIKGKVA